MISNVLVPLIAIITLYIAFQQYRLDRFKTRRLIYPERIEVFRAVIRFLQHVNAHAMSPREHLAI